MRLMSLKIIFVLLAPMYFLGCASPATGPVNTPAEDQVDANQKASEVNTQLGTQYLSKGNLELADNKLRRALNQNPNNATANWVYALLQERLGEYSLAEKHFNKAIKIAPDDSRAHNNYGTFLCNRGRIKEAETAFLKAIDNPLYKQSDSAYLNAGICMLKLPDEAKAEEYFVKSLEVNSRQRGALYQLAVLTFERGDLDSANYYVQKYENVGVHNSKTLWIAHSCAVKLGQEENAEFYANELKKKHPASEEARLLAEKYWYAGTKQQ